VGEGESERVCVCLSAHTCVFVNKCMCVCEQVHVCVFVLCVLLVCVCYVLRTWSEACMRGRHTSCTCMVWMLWAR
jgi:hypothetical protein